MGVREWWVGTGSIHQHDKKDYTIHNISVLSLSPKKKMCKRTCARCGHADHSIKQQSAKKREQTLTVRQ